jgi:hypothetical protein
MIGVIVEEIYRYLPDPPATEITITVVGERKTSTDNEPLERKKENRIFFVIFDFGSRTVDLIIITRTNHKT